MSTRTWKLLLQVVITVLVVTFVALAFWRPLRQLREHPFTCDPKWLAASGGLYLVGLSFALTFWWLAMLSLGQRPELRRVPWAYFMGHLAKYVPGKALVVLLRTVLVKGPHCRAEVAAVTVIYDTILYMAVGAVFAAVVVLIQGPFGEHLQYWHIALLLGGLIPFAVPPIFNAIMHWLTRPLRRLPDGSHAPFPRLGVRLLALGIVMQTGCVIFTALSLAAVIVSVRPDVSVVPMIPELTAKLSAAVVLGFVIPTPAGLGTREYALMLLLQDDLGQDYAALVPLLMRLVWLAAECVIVAVLFPFRRNSKS